MTDLDTTAIVEQLRTHATSLRGEADRLDQAAELLDGDPTSPSSGSSARSTTRTVLNTTAGRTTRERVPCPRCEKTFPTAQGLRVHTARIHGPNADKPTPPPTPTVPAVGPLGPIQRPPVDLDAARARAANEL
jgi:hypothetical protein